MKKLFPIAFCASLVALLCVSCGGVETPDPNDPNDPNNPATEDLYSQLIPPPFHGTPLENLECAPNEILYCTKYGFPIEPTQTSGYNGTLQSNTYENGVGRLVFDTDVTIIPGKAFEKCHSLTYMKFPSTLTAIYKRAFAECENLISLYLPENVKVFDSNVLDGCLAFEVLYMNLDKLITTIIKIEGNDSFVVCVPEALMADCIDDPVDPWSTSPVSLPFAAYDFENNKVCSDYVLLYKTNNGEPAQLYEDDGQYTDVTRMGQVLGANVCRPSGLGALFFGYPLTTIPSSLLDQFDKWVDNHHITYIKVPSSTTVIGDYALAETSIEEIDIPDNVERLGEFALDCCTSLKKVTLGRGITSISLGAFDGAKSLEKFYCKATTPPSIHQWGIFQDYPESFTIYVPEESLEAYRTDPNWEKYSEYIKGYKF